MASQYMPLSAKRQQYSAVSISMLNPMLMKPHLSGLNLVVPTTEV